MSAWIRYVSYGFVLHFFVFYELPISWACMSETIVRVLSGIYSSFCFPSLLCASVSVSACKKPTFGIRACDLQ